MMKEGISQDAGKLRLTLRSLFASVRKARYFSSARSTLYGRIKYPGMGNNFTKWGTTEPSAVTFPLEILVVCRTF